MMRKPLRAMPFVLLPLPLCSGERGATSRIRGPDLVAEHASQLRKLRRDEGSTILIGRILAEVILVIRLRSIKLRRGHDLRHDRVVEETGRGQLLLVRFRHLALGVVVPEDRGTVV